MFVVTPNENLQNYAMMEIDLTGRDVLQIVCQFFQHGLIQEETQPLLTLAFLNTWMDTLLAQSNVMTITLIIQTVVQTHQ